MNEVNTVFDGDILAVCKILEHHQFEFAGGRQCPAGLDGCSQSVYKCSLCGQYDYGEVGGPAHNECIECDRVVVDGNKFLPNEYEEIEEAK